MPLLGLVAAVAGAVLVGEGRFGTPAGAPVASLPVPGLATSVGTLSPTQPQPQPQPQPPATPAAPAGAATQASATQASAAQASAAQASAAQASPTQSTENGAPVATAVAAGTLTGSVTPTASQVAAAAAPAAGPFRTYRVQPGDTLRFVADLYGVSAASVAQASGLQNRDQLRVGQLLTIPSQPGYLYRVQPGETLDLIAARAGVQIDIIVSASKLSSATVHAGDVVLIPDQPTGRNK